jgi:hypothetical protein
MNADRRKQLGIIASELDVLMERLDTIRADEESAREAMPESLQNSERGEQSQTAIDALDSAYSDLDCAVTSIREVQES